MPEFGPDAPIGYAGMTLASAIGIPLAVAEPRIRAAIYGGVFVYDAMLEAARKVTIPIEFLLPWDDPEIDRNSGLTLFGAFASKEKTLHAFPGSHFHVPTERIDTRFFARKLGATGRATAQDVPMAGNLLRGSAGDLVMTTMRGRNHGSGDAK